MPESIARLHRQLSKIKNPLKQLPIMLQLGNLYMKDHPTKAIEIGRDTLQLAKASSQELLMLEALFIIARSLHSLSDHQASIDTYDEICRLATSHRYEFALSISLSEMSLPLKSLGEYKRAIDVLNSTLVLQQRLGAVNEVARTQHRMASVYLLLADNIKTKELCLQSLELLKAEPDKLLEAEVYSSLGWAYTDLQEFDNAIEVHSIDLAISTDLGDLYRQASALGNLGQIYGRLNKFEQALQYFHRALFIQQQLSNTRHQAISHANIANVFALTGKLETAFSHVDISIQLASSVTDYYTVGMCLFTKGSHLVANKRFAEGLECLLKARTMLENGMPNNERVTLFYATSVGYEGIGDTIKALECYKLFIKAKETLLAEQLHRQQVILQTRLSLEQSTADRKHYEEKTSHLEFEVKELTKQLIAVKGQLARQTEFLQEIVNKIERLLHHSDLLDLQEKLQIILRESKKQLSSEHIHSQLTDALSNLPLTFQNKLQRAYPTLSDTELKVCGLIRLGFETDRISNLLFASKRTVEWHRANIRKKMSIPEATEISVFLLQLFPI